ncbi:MAG: dihydrodipicolinate synthase family protein, partial [Acidobacteria bacterium]
MNWKGVMPAITTSFNQDLTIDHGYVGEHCRWMLENGCTGVVALGSLGEGATLSYDEKLEILRTCVRSLNQRAPVVAAISSLTTSDAASLAKEAADLGCEGLMVLPPYVYQGDWREMKAHIASVFEASPLSCMLYNNPVAYGTDFLPEQIAELAAEYPNLEAVKESSTD